VILNSYIKYGAEVRKNCSELGCPDFTLAEISGFDWYDDMSPWAVPSVGGNEPQTGGKADACLELLTGKILPKIKDEAGVEPRCVMLAGYSLAGLFALYASTRCAEFRAVASCSGSMWFPGFREYIETRDAGVFPELVYLSLGDREARTGNELLRTVEENTAVISSVLARNGVKTYFEMNKGNHFKQSALRTAKGIKWILEEAK
jgi:predicted alpha/beta superfamily hydrolase